MLGRLKQIFNIKSKSNKFSVQEKIEQLFHSLKEDEIRIEFGTDLIPYNSVVCTVVGSIRAEIKDELGFIMPAVHILDNQSLQENEYLIKIQGEVVHRGFVIPNREGITEEIYENTKNVLISNFNQLLTNELTEKYIESVRVNNSLLVWDITGAISTSEIRIILSDLLNSGKSIKNISKIFEKISEQIFVENKYNSRNPHTISKAISKQI